MKLENIGRKIIGIGEVTILPGETREIPEAYQTSPILEVYKNCGMARITGDLPAFRKTEEDLAREKEEEEKKKATDAEKLRQMRLASLEGISEEALARLANELGINYAKCKDQADVLKKVRAALEK
jgi:hypothetical protein